MNEKHSFKKVSIKKVGPIYQLSGDFIMYPNISYPLKGYEFKEISGMKDFFDSIEKSAQSWWDKFPNCCDSHKRFNSIPNFDKYKYEFVVKQISNSIRYFIHCMEINIEEENWFEVITQYFDYLKINFGSPEWGNSLFTQGILNFIEWASFDSFDFNDDMKLQLIGYISPSQQEIKKRKNENGDITELYKVFHTWLESMPDIGEISNIKSKLNGKLPMNFFLYNIKANRFSGLSSSNVKTTTQLIIDLENYSKTLLIAIDHSLKEDFLSNNKTVIQLINEKRRIRQNKLFKDDLIPANGIVNEWLNLWIDYFKEIKAINLTKDFSTFVRKADNFFLDYVKDFDLLNSNIAQLRKDLTLLSEDIKQEHLITLKSLSDSIISSIDDFNYEKLILDKVVDKMIAQLHKSNKVKVKNAVKSMTKTHIGIKHKLILSVPLFLFTKYQGEIKLGRSDAIPKNLGELKTLLFGK